MNLTAEPGAAVLEPSGAVTGQATVAITLTAVVDLVITKNDEPSTIVARAGVT